MEASDKKPRKSREPNGLVIFVVWIAVAAALGTFFHWRNERNRPPRLDNTVCMDGTRTISSGQGACAHHGGIRGYLR